MSLEPALRIDSPWGPKVLPSLTCELPFGVGYFMRGDDDCLHACVATCLQIPYDDVPQMTRDPEIEEFAESVGFRRPPPPHAPHAPSAPPPRRTLGGGLRAPAGRRWVLPLLRSARRRDVPDDYRHNQQAVDAAVTAAVERFDVRSIRVDPQFVESLLATWQARWGDDIMVPFYTNTQTAKIAHGVRLYGEAIASGELSHDGDPTLTAHVRNAVRRPVHVRDDDDDRPLFTIRKDHPNSPRKIDGAMAAVMGWEARYELVSQHMEPAASNDIEETQLRELPGQEYVDRRGGLVLRGEHHRDRESGEDTGPRRGR